MKNRTPLRSGFAVLLTVCMVLCTLPLTAAAAKSDEIKQQLDSLKEENAEIQAQIDEIQGQYDINATEIKQLVDKKNAVDKEIALLHTQVNNINQQIISYSQLIADSQDDLDEAEILLDRLNEKYRQRVRAMEEEGTISYWQVLFQAKSFTDFLDRVNLIDEIAEADQRRLSEMKQAADLVQSAQDRLFGEKADLEQSQEELARSQEMLEEKRTESDDILRDLAARQEEFLLLLDESEAKQDALMKEIAQKEKEYSNAKYQDKLAKLALQGNNPPSDATWLTPVSGYTITSAFGRRIHPVYGSQLMHNGIDMACPQGTPIYATRAGTVTMASYQAGGAGYYVSINHGDGFSSIYMHMTHYVVSAGQSVSAGQLIGYVGNTGVSTGPHLHFGISYAGTYVNPLAYI